MLDLKTGALVLAVFGCCVSFVLIIDLAAVVALLWVRNYVYPTADWGFHERN